MEKIVDLHIHSRFARGTSKELTVSNVYKWCKIKGINVIGTGDFTHPKWFSELTEQLEPDDGGLYRLKDRFADPVDKLLPKSVKDNEVRFVLTSEISNIYAKNGKTRRLHNLVIVPNFDTAAKIISALSTIGNLAADGRPILGLDSKELLKITLATDPDSLFVPAHIWTPWFSMFGSKSGFDSIEEAFEELSPEIKVIETGLSSDPFMNWQISSLQKRTVISNSDAHSPAKMAREANLLDTDLNYKNIITTIKTNNDKFLGTIEFFPQEGMYHLDGHRKCQIRFTPEETKEHNGICPKCGKPLVVGVLNRVEELAVKQNRIEQNINKDASKTSGTDSFTKNSFIPQKKVEYIVPLIEILAEIKGVKNAQTVSVIKDYEKLYSEFGSEFNILRKTETKEIADAGFSKVAYALEKNA